VARRQALVLQRGADRQRVQVLQRGADRQRAQVLQRVAAPRPPDRQREPAKRPGPLPVVGRRRALVAAPAVFDRPAEPPVLALERGELPVAGRTLAQALGRVGVQQAEAPRAEAWRRWGPERRVSPQLLLR